MAVLAALVVGGGAADRAAAGRAAGGPVFVDEAAEAGVLLRNVSGGAEKRTILETTGAGACFLDYDLDGDVDLYIVNGATVETVWSAEAARDALYRNDGGGRFADVTGEAGLVERGWGGGCAAGDYDNDGDPDLYLTHFGPNVLLRNEGDGRFADVTAAAGVAGAGWSLGAAFVDVERDGDLDLFVARYLRFQTTDRPASDSCTWKGIPVMCGPRGFPGETDVLYRNNGDGTFAEASAAFGVGGAAPLYGMGVVAGDVDGDGDTDVFVANDSQDNHLFVNDGAARYEDRALAAGVALSGDGRQQASMGADLGDYDNDGDEDLAVTNFSDDYHTLYRNEGGGLFVDVTAAAGLDAGRRSTLGWGAVFLDYDNDADLDLFIATGHVYPQVDGRDPVTSYRQQNRLFRNDGGTFVDVSNDAGPGLRPARASRGVALGDYDDDGDLDLAVIQENDVPALLRNDGGNARRWLKVRLRGTRSNRDGIGARLRVTTGETTQLREVRLSSGYLSSHDPRVHFGLGGAARVDRLEVVWPSGRVQAMDGLPADRLITIDEDAGLVGAVTLDRTLRPQRVGNGRRPDGPSTAPARRAPAWTLPVPSGAALSPRARREVEALARSGTQGILAGDYARGIVALEDAIRRLPAGEPGPHRAFLASLYDNLGVGLMRAERLDECAGAIAQAIALAPGRGKSHHNLGLCHYHARRFGPAVDALRAALSAGGAGESLSCDLGRALASAGRCSEAVSALERALERLPRLDPEGRRAEAWYHLGGCRADAGRHAGAADAFRETLALVPGHQKALYKLGLAVRAGGEAERAERVQALFQARQAADEVVRSLKRSGPRTTKDRLDVARTFRDAGLPAEALTEAQKVLAADPVDASALVIAGELYLALRPPGLEAAERAFADALRSSAREPDALAGMGEVRRRQGRAGDARPLFERALAAEPGHLAAAVGLARLELAAGRAAEAAQRLEGRLARRPEEPSVLLALAEIYASAPSGPARRPDDALRLLDRVKALYGEDVAIRARALAAAGRTAEAEALVAESPFLGNAERLALRALAN